MATARKRTKKTTAARKSKTAAKKPAAKKTSPSGPSVKKAAGKKAAGKKTAGKTTAKKAAAKKPTAKKPTTGKVTAKRAAVKKNTAAKISAKKPAAKKSSGKKAVAKKTGAKKSSAKKPARKKTGGPDVVNADAALFAALTEGERADALRIMTEDPRLAGMASVGRYRVIAVEPLAIKPPHDLSNHRLARLVIYDYAADRSVDGCVDLDNGRVTHLNISRAQPMLAPEEERAAIAIAMDDDRVKKELSLGDEPQVAMHYWSRSDTSVSYSRRSAAVIFGRSHQSPSLIAVVDLLDNLVCEIVPAQQW